MLTNRNRDVWEENSWIIFLISVNIIHIQISLRGKCSLLLKLISFLPFNEVVSVILKLYVKRFSMTSAASKAGQHQCPSDHVVVIESVAHIDLTLFSYQITPNIHVNR